MKGSNGQGKGEDAGKGGEEDGEAGAGGAEIKAKRCRETRATYKAKGLWRERERDGEGKRKREGRWKEGGRESVPQGRANAAFTFHLSRGHNLLQQGSACPQFDKSNCGSDKCRPSAAVDSAVGVAARQSRRQWLLVSTPQPVQLALCLIQPVARGVCMLCVIMCASLGLYVVASRVASVAHTLPVARCEIEITYLIAEDLYLTVAAMEDRRIARILERIDLYMQRQALCV